MVADVGYRFASIYVGGGTPTVMPEEPAATIDRAAGRLQTLNVDTLAHTGANRVSCVLPADGLAGAGEAPRAGAGRGSTDDGTHAMTGTKTDVFEAPTSHRPYREPLANDDALTVLEPGQGTHSVPQVVDAVLDPENDRPGAVGRSGAVADARREPTGRGLCEDLSTGATP